MSVYTEAISLYDRGIFLKGTALCAAIAGAEYLQDYLLRGNDIQSFYAPEGNAGGHWPGSGKNNAALTRKYLSYQLQLVEEMEQKALLQNPNMWDIFPGWEEVFRRVMEGAKALVA